MTKWVLHDFHAGHGGVFGEVNGAAVVRNYGDPAAEYAALRGAAAVFDLSFRSRVCVLGTDAERFLHGQVTNDIKALHPGEGCYTALVNAKARIESDLNVYRLADEFLLDFEPGLTAAVTQRFDRFIIADDVRVVDAAPHYGLLSVQGPRAAQAVAALDLGVACPDREMAVALAKHATFGDVYVANQPRVGLPGFDLFVPVAALPAMAAALTEVVLGLGGRLAGWEALELARIEAGVPRFGQDMDATNLAPEAGIEARAISYTKGCYIGQEIIARLRTYGQVAKALRGLRLAGECRSLPARGDKLVREGKEVGYLTSAAVSPRVGGTIALAYVRRECNAVGTDLVVAGPAGNTPAVIVPLPFVSAAGV
ncbi:MAG: aminomethyl transferase family protein [Verrucomicrobia bacterium]|nr:aminomethyl transferase family protein [Verrucomicrobiota bacterium]